MRERKEDRNQAIWKAHKEGKMQKEIAEEFGLSRGRVCKIIEYYRIRPYKYPAMREGEDE